MRRVVVVGNAGSGKTYLASTLASRFDLVNVELDGLNWVPGQFNQRRPPEEAIAAVKSASLENRWVIEGVYGWLAAVALPRAENLIWLDIPEEECIANLLGRPIKSGEDEGSRQALVAWCREYRDRRNSSSYVAHRRLFEQFPSRKDLLRSRAEINDFLAANSNVDG